MRARAGWPAADAQVVRRCDKHLTMGRHDIVDRSRAVGLLDGLLGNASEIEPERIQQGFAQILMPGERVDKAYQLIRDVFFFTDKRLVIVDKQGITGAKIE